MAIRLTTLDSYKIKIVANGKAYWFRRNEWTPVDRPDDLRRLLGPTRHGPILKEETELAPYYMVSSQDYKANLYTDWKHKKFTLKAGRWYETDRVTAAKLTRNDLVRHVTPSEFLRKNPKARILIKRDEGMGDLMFFTAAVKALRNKHPKANLTLATKTTFVEWMRNSNLFNLVINFLECYDYAPFDLATDLINWTEMHPLAGIMIRPEIFALGLGVSCNGDYRGVCNVESGLAQGLLPESLTNGVAIDLTGSSWRRGPSSEYSRSLVEELARNFITPIGVADRQLSWWPEVGVDLNGKLSTMEYISLLKDFPTISVDTGTLHISNAMNQRCIGLFGPIPSKLRVGDTPNLVAMNSPMECDVCRQASEDCKFGKVAKCFEAIPIEQIVTEARNMVGL